jgi:hypothetical protein
MKKFEFTYLIKEVDIQNCHVLVEYTPADTKLTKLTFNIPTSIPNENGVIKPAMQTVVDFAPHNIWGAQELLLAEPNLLNSTATVTPE